MRALKISLAGLAATAALQGVVVVVSGSIALLSDTLHNLADALTALPLWLAFNLGRRPATRRLTYGYGRAEDLAGLVVVVLIAASAAGAAWQGIAGLRDPQEVRNVGLVIAAALIGMVGNEAVAAYRIRVGRRIGSAALVADGLHARADGLTSAAVLVGALATAAGWEWADPAVGLAIAAAIVVVLVQAVRAVGGRLMDAVDPALVERAESVIASVPGVEEVTEVRIRWLGHRLLAEGRVTVDRSLDVVAAHEVSEAVHHALLHDVPMLARAVIHVDPSTSHGSDPHASTAHHFVVGPATPASGGNGRPAPDVRANEAGTH